MKKLLITFLSILTLAMCAIGLTACGHEALGCDNQNILAVPPTCENAGLTEGKTACSRCGKGAVAQQIVPALGCNNQVLDAVAPTCTETGLTEGISGCSRCGKGAVAQQFVPALGCDNQVLDAVAPTCTETGLTEGMSECSRCGQGGVAQEPINSLGRQHDYIICVCSVCGDRQSVSHGLKYVYLSDSDSYMVEDKGDCADLNVIIPAEYNDGIHGKKYVTSIGEYAFCVWDYYPLTSIEIPASVQSIGENAFYYCSSLESVTFGENSQLTSIGASAFESCQSLKSIEIPITVTNIGSFAFSDCKTLTYNKKDGLKYLGNSINKYLYLAGATDNSINTVTIDANCKFIGSNVFEDCQSLTCIEIPTGVKSIGNGAFANCYSLKSVTFGENSQLTNIDSNAFWSCKSLTSIEISANVTSIGAYAFAHCESLTSITFQGTKAEWDNISKDYYWRYQTYGFTIYYTDT